MPQSISHLTRIDKLPAIKEVGMMKRWFIIAVFASVLPLAGGSGAAVSQIAPQLPPRNVVVPYGQLARVGNTDEVCGASRTSVSFNKGPKQSAPLLACWGSKSGKPVIGAHVNMGVLVNGSMVAATGVWMRANGVTFVSKRSYYYPAEWETGTAGAGASWSPPVIFTDLYLLPASQLASKVKLRLKMWDDFKPGSRKVGFSCTVSVAQEDWTQFPRGTTLVGCSPDQFFVPGDVCTSIFWPPWGKENLQIECRHHELAPVKP